MYQLKKGSLRKTFRSENKQQGRALNATYGFYSWFRNGTLYAGLAYWPELQQSPAPKFEFNHDIIEHDLTYQDEQSVRVKVRAVSINRDNTKTEVELGDPEGEQRTLTYYNVTKKELTEFATRDLEKFRYTGYRGSFLRRNKIQFGKLPADLMDAVYDFCRLLWRRLFLTGSILRQQRIIHTYSF